MNLSIPEKFTGIIQLIPVDTTEILLLQQTVLRKYIKQQPNPKLHVTLLHQSFPKKVFNNEGVRGDKALKNLYKNGGHLGIPTPVMQLGDVRISEDSTTGRVSSYVTIENTASFLEMRDMILEAAGIDSTSLKDILSKEEQDRIFHISLTNLEGTSGASVAYPQTTDKKVSTC